MIIRRRRIQVEIEHHTVHTEIILTAPAAAEPTMPAGQPAPDPTPTPELPSSTAALPGKDTSANFCDTE